MQSWSSSAANQGVCTHLTGFLEDIQPTSHWQDFGVLTNHNKHARETMPKRGDVATVLSCDLVGLACWHAPMLANAQHEVLPGLLRM